MITTRLLYQLSCFGQRHIWTGYSTKRERARSETICMTSEPLVMLLKHLQCWPAKHEWHRMSPVGNVSWCYSDVTVMLRCSCHCYWCCPYQVMEPIDVPCRCATSCAILRHPQTLAGLSFQSNVASAQLLLASESASHSASKQDYVELRNLMES